MSFFAISQGKKCPLVSSLPPINHSIGTGCLILLMSCQHWSFGALTRVMSLVKLNPLVEKMVPSWIRLVWHIQQVFDRLGSRVFGGRGTSYVSLLCSFSCSWAVYVWQGSLACKGEGYLFCSSFRWVVSVKLPSTGMPAPKVLQQRFGVAQ